MKKALLITVLLGTLSFSSFAQNSNEKVIELFQLMKTDKMIDVMMDNMMGLMGSQSGPVKSASQEKIQAEYKTFAIQETKLLGKKIMNVDMVALYTKHFTSEEIQKYIDFYSTPEGKKMLDLAPAIQKEFMTSFIANDMPGFQAKFKTKMEELQKQYPEANPAPVKKAN